MKNEERRMKNDLQRTSTAVEFGIALLASLFFFLPFFVSAQEISILVPTDEATISVDTEVKLRIVTKDFLFVDYKNNSELYPGNPNAGQAIFWLDPENEPRTEDGNKMLSDNTVNLGILEEGRHRIVVELLRNDLSRFEPPVLTETNFSVRGQNQAGNNSGIFISIALLFFVAILYLLFRRAYRRFTRHSK